MSKAIYNETCVSIYCNRCSIRLKFYLEFVFFLSVAVLGNKHILFAYAMALFDIAYKKTKMCLLTDRLLLLFRFRYPQD